MTTWLSDASANRHIKTYVKDFLDVSGNMTVRQTDDYDWNAYGQHISGQYETDDATYLGIGVGMDVSGLTMVVGAPGQDGANTTSTKDGSVIVYRYDTNAEIWYQLGNTILGETDNYDFGFNVDINDAGTRIMATNHTTGDFVNVYDYNSGTNTWDKQVTITAHTIGRYAGRISGDGNTIIFGDYLDNSNTGKQYVYRNTSGTTWTLIGEFTGSYTNVYSALGPAITYDGNRVSFPEPEYGFDADGNSSTSNGRVTIYDYSGSGTTWTQVGDPIYGRISSAALGKGGEDFSKDGSIIAIGGKDTYDLAEVYQYENGSWKQLGTTITGTSSFGTGLRLSDDGTTLLVNDNSEDTAGTDNGALYIYKYINGDWVQQGSTLYGQYTGAQLGLEFGGGIAISGDGTKIVAGGYLADVNSTNSGYVQSWQWSQKTYTNPALDISGGTMTMWGGAEHMATNYSVTQLGADIDEYNDNGTGSNERSNTLYFSSDGTTLYIGHQLGYNEYSERTGTFRVMKYRNGEWYKIGSTIAPRESEIGVFQGTSHTTYYSGGGLSSDGTRAMGAWYNYNYDNTDRKGLMRVYDLIDGDWVQVGNDIEDTSSTELLFTGIMSGDGNTVAYRDNHSTYAKIMTYNSSTNTWDLQTTITGSVNIMGLSYDGTIRVDIDTSTSGDYKAIVYKYAGGSWSQIGQELKSYEVADDESFNVANLSKYGDYLIVGDKDSFTDTGVAIVYKYSSEGDIWMQLGGNIQNPFATESHFVTAGGISEDGKTIVLTDYLSRGSDDYQGNDGAIAVYKYFDGNWTEIFNYDGVEDAAQLGFGGAMCDNGELFAISSAGSFFARTYKITNNPALKIQDGNAQAYNLTVIGQDSETQTRGGLTVEVPDVPNDGYAYLKMVGKRTEGTYKNREGYIGTGADSGNFGCNMIFKTKNTDKEDVSWDEATERMRIDSNGYVGIGTTSPGQLLHVHNDSGTAYIQLTAGTTMGTTQYNGLEFATITGGDAFIMQNEAANLRVNTNGTERMRIQSDGYIGIGTTTAYAPVHIHSSNLTGIEGNKGAYFRWAENNSGTITYNSSNVYLNVGLRSYQSIATNAYIISFSDRRLKKDIVDLKDDSSLQKIRLLNPTSYKYRDPVVKNEYNTVDGFIAQEVREVMPHAIGIVTDILPNIMLFGTSIVDSSNNYILTIPDFDTATLELDASNNIYPKLKIIDENDKDIIVNIKEVISTTQIKVESDESMQDEIFIYGQEVDNVHTIVKDKIFTTGISALQEVDRQQQADKARIATLESQVADLLARVSSLESA